MSNELLWYTGRGTGVISLVLLTLVLVLGIVGRSGRSAAGLTRFALLDVHRNASLMAVVLVLVHLIVLWADPYARLRVFDLLIPFNAAYRPFWVGLGTISFELLVVLIVTSLVRSHLGARLWRLVHWLSYGLWPIAWLHGWFTGTDAGKWWFRLIAIACLLAGVAAAAWRLSPTFLEIPRPRVRAEPAPPVVPGMTPTAPRHAGAGQPSWNADSWYREPTWHGQYGSGPAATPGPPPPDWREQTSGRLRAVPPEDWREHTSGRLRAVPPEDWREQTSGRLRAVRPEDWQ